MGSLPSRRKQIRTPPSPEDSQDFGLDSRQSGVNTPIAVAVCNFPSGHAEPILRMGEQLNLLSEDGDWWKVVSVATGKDCYIPSNHVAKISHRWLYEGINREKAEELLLLPSNHEGSFLIRERQMRKGCYSLSVRHTNHESWDCVKHYRINRLENSWLYISPRLTFSSLQELVDYYSEIGEGLCCCLKAPCFIEGYNSGLQHSLSKPIVVKKPAFNWQEINSSDLLDNQLPEDSPISLGLREAISSYLLITEDLPSEDTFSKKERRRNDT
ncbi:src-like-adapter 2 [Hemicordylus capensis]|uniref:src-like-adapter 2 n=1 Tax=Hemicordylus capensis TaxID=884348 RepID=UPI00230387F8|nr:src-like-adapter 2 [Hemicordylus capensis]XP_053101548.1 src-like-adapter 2 [Hemicordylus capensis]XP_053101549.1 src-like-adapter 2 [Hemicordylus capensis]